MIIKDGVDVTDEVMETASLNARLQAHTHSHYAEVKELLALAKLSLNNISPPWCDDRIYKAYHAIETAEAALEGKNG